MRRVPRAYVPAKWLGNKGPEIGSKSLSNSGLREFPVKEDTIPFSSPGQLISDSEENAIKIVCMFGQTQNTRGAMKLVVDEVFSGESLKNGGLTNTGIAIDQNREFHCCRKKLLSVSLLFE